LDYNDASSILQKVEANYGCPDFERIRKSARREEPDRVPLCEVLVEYPIQSRFLGREVVSEDLDAQVEFWHRAGYDYVPITVGMMAPGRVTEESSISQTILKEIRAKNADDETQWNIEHVSFIKDRSDYERFPWEAASRIDLGKLLAVKDKLPSGMRAIAVSGKIFTLTWMLMGFNNFGVSLLLNEGLVADIVKRVAGIQFEALQQIFELPHVAAVWAVDDIACGTGTIISPQALRDHLFPWYKRMADLCHAHGRLFFFHSDGDLMPIMEDLIALDIDVLHPIDPTCMNIGKVKELYGERICLAGNISNELLQRGTPEQVRALVIKRIQVLAPGGGYCLGSGNSVTDWSRFENYMAMRETALEHGTYPIGPGSPYAQRL
jgi:uroporphyrinogen decarboxylase